MESLEFLPVTRERWPDLETLFSESAGEDLGNPSRCWCMEWRLEEHQDWIEGAGDVNHGRMRDFVGGGQVPGIIAYVDGQPAGWCSVSPRPQLIGLRAAGNYRNFDDVSVWVVICFYVPETRRGMGMMGRLLEAAAEYAFESGARVVEGYPFAKEWADDGAGGTIEVFKRAGFTETRRLSEHQALMRRYAPNADA
jgi:GNAT superfamily N-acetyltransferase